MSSSGPQAEHQVDRLVQRRCVVDGAERDLVAAFVVAASFAAW
ncbi:hypothetical protein [Sorangium sp. So ce363]